MRHMWQNIKTGESIYEYPLCTFLLFYMFEKFNSKKKLRLSLYLSHSDSRSPYLIL